MSRLSQIFAPKEREFFDLFEEAASNAMRAAELLEHMLQTWPDHGEALRDVVVCEQEGDRITHDIIQRLNQTFVTPFDREDIIDLASAMDNIVDFIEEIADFLGLFQIEAPTDQAQRMARVLHEAARQVNGAMPALRRLEDIRTFMVEVNRLENEGDRILREAVATLFNHGIDPMMVIRWKDIYERLEDAIDATETAMNIMSGIIIKNR
jgi:predicted phosphate transport protein (TIGR00153 family)